MDSFAKPPVDVFGTRSRRVALVSSSYDPYPGGVEQHVRSVARELRARGHDVVVWTVDRGEHLGVRLVDGIEVHYLPTPLPARTVRAVLRFLFVAPAACLAWWRLWRRFRPDVLHVQCFGPNGLYALVLATLTRSQLVISTHGETFADDHAVFDASALLMAGMRRALKSSQVVTACSQVVLDDLEDRFGFKGGLVVPNGIDLEQVEVTRVADAVGSVFAVGRLEWNKGFDLLLEAFARADLPATTRLVIGGDGPLKELLRRRAEELGVEGRVQLPGRLTPAQVAGAMGDAAVVVVPSRREAFGIVVLEAWRAGAALVVTSRGGPAQLVTDELTGLVRDPKDTEAFARALGTVLADAALAGRLGAAGRAAVQEYPWNRVAEMYEDCYDGGGRR